MATALNAPPVAQLPTACRGGSLLPFGANDPSRDRDEADEHDAQHPTERGDIEPRRADPRDDDCGEGQEQADGEARHRDHAKMRVRLPRGRSDSRHLVVDSEAEDRVAPERGDAQHHGQHTEEDHPADRDLSKRVGPQRCAP